MCYDHCLLCVLIFLLIIFQSNIVMSLLFVQLTNGIFHADAQKPFWRGNGVKKSKWVLMAVPLPVGFSVFLCFYAFISVTASVCKSLFMSFLQCKLGVTALYIMHTVHEDKDSWHLVACHSGYMYPGAMTTLTDNHTRVFYTHTHAHPCTHIYCAEAKL